jgi:hypothetical protein
LRLRLSWAVTIVNFMDRKEFSEDDDYALFKLNIVD